MFLKLFSIVLKRNTSNIATPCLLLVGKDHSFLVMRSIGRIAVHRDLWEQPMSDSINAKILEVLELLRPALQADGGDVEFLSFDDQEGIVELRLLGACESCPISMMTLKEGIERRLKGSVPEVIEVTAV